MVQRNKKKSTTKRPVTQYAIRKERKRGLAEQARQMQVELDRLKLLVLVDKGEMDKATRRTKLENEVLHEFVQEQHLPFAQTQAALASHVQRTLGSIQPGQSVISLGTDRAERQRTLKAIKDSKLDYGERYIAARSLGLDLTSSYCQEERVDTPGRDYCYTRFEVMPLYGFSVGEAFSAIMNCIANAEMVLAEIFGSLSVREDNEFESQEVHQIRLASAVSTGSIVESNTAVFSRFYDGGGNERDAYGTVTLDFVDFDALYPYQTGRRLRTDTTSVVTVRPLYGEKKKAGHDGPGVVITRWTSLKLIRDGTTVIKDPEVELKESSVCWGDTAKKCVERQFAREMAVELA